MGKTLIQHVFPFLRPKRIESFDSNDLGKMTAEKKLFLLLDFWPCKNESYGNNLIYGHNFAMALTNGNHR